MTQTVDPNTRVIVNKASAELLEIKHKRQLNKRIRALEADVLLMQAQIAELLEKKPSVV